jgi:hypothetical protein
MEQQFEHSAEAELHTEKGAKAFRRLCIHFSQKVPATWDDESGRVEFPESGECLFEADDQTLRAHCRAISPEMLDQLCEVVSTHYEKYFHEPLVFAKA